MRTRPEHRRILPQGMAIGLASFRPGLLAAEDLPMPWLEGRFGWSLVVVLALVGIGVCVWAWLAVRRGAGARRCPKCGFDMRSTVGRRCGECGREARSEWHLRRLRPWTRRALIALGVLIATSYPVYRAVLWSHDRNWSPPLPMWRSDTTFQLSNGAVVEFQSSRERRKYSLRSLVTPPRGEPIAFEGAHFFADFLDPSHSVPVEQDLNRDGTPEFVLREYSGGSHCCETLYILSVHADGSVTEIARIDARSGGNFTDVDGDGINEIEMGDWSLSYELGCYACIRLPRLVFRVTATGVELATDLMRTPASLDDALRKLIRDLDDVGAWPPLALDEPRGDWDPTDLHRQVLVSNMLNLIYSGHADLAWMLLDRMWPVRIEGEREAQRQAIHTALAKSPWHAAIDAMQERSEAGANSEFDETKRSAAPAAAP